MELGQLAHPIVIDLSAVGDAVFLVFVTLALVLRLLFLLVLVVSALVKQRRVRVIQNVLRMRANFPQRVDEPLRSLVHSCVRVIQLVVWALLVQ